MTMRGLTYLDQKRFGRTLLMKYASIASVMSKSAITPDFIGRMATMLPGVRPSMRFASAPTASTRLEPAWIATTEGSRSTTPWFFAYTSEFAVPRSMPISVENSDCIFLRHINDCLLLPIYVYFTANLRGGQ